MTFSAKKRFFEKEIEQTVQPATKPERRFSFLSEDEVEKLRQEEEKKIAALTDEQLRNLSRLDDVDEEEEDDVKRAEAAVETAQHAAPTTAVLSAPTSQAPVTPTVVRTAKAEKRLKEKLQREGLELSEEEKQLSPAEQRILQAKKRAAWREARLKSLEQDAMQAEMVIKKMSELAESNMSPITSLRSLSLSNASGSNEDGNGNNNDDETDYSNNNESEQTSAAAHGSNEEDDEVADDDAADGAGDTYDGSPNFGNVSTSTSSGRRKTRAKRRIANR